MRETQVQSLGREDPPGERNGNPLHYSCRENSVDGAAWEATVHGVARSWTRLSDFTSFCFTFWNRALQGQATTVFQTTFKRYYPWYSYFPICLLPKFTCDPKINTWGAFTVCRHAQSSKNSTLPMPIFLERDIRCLCVPALRLKTNILFIIDLLPHFLNCCTFCCFHCFKWQAYSWRVFYVPEPRRLRCALQS